MQQSTTPDLGPRQALDAQLQANTEQQQQHTGMGNLFKQFIAMLAKGIEQEPSSQITDQRRLAQMTKNQTQHKRQGKP